MTVSTIDSAAEFVTNGVTTNYPFYFKFLANEDLVVTYVSPAGVSSVLTLGTQYTVNGAGNDQGGSVVTTTALAGPGQLVVSREMDAYQQTSLRNQGKFLAETHEDVFDRLTMLIQQGFAAFKRALTRPFGRDYFFAENRRIVSVKDPVDAQDAATKNWVGLLLDGVSGVVNTTVGIAYDAGTLFDHLRFGVARTVDSIAALRALSGSRNQRAFVLGYYGKGDGGGGVYFIDPLDTTTADNGGTVIVAADGARWKMPVTGAAISIKAFGAKADGVSNDSPAAAASLAALGYVFLVRSLTPYVIGDITLGTNQSFIAEPGSKTRVNLPASAAYGLRVTSYAGLSASIQGRFGVIENIHFDGAACAVTTTAIRHATSSGVVFGVRGKNLNFTNFGEAIGDEAHATNYVVDLIFEDCCASFTRARQIYFKRSAGFIYFKAFKVDHTMNTGAVTWEGARFDQVAGIELDQFDVLGPAGQNTYQAGSIALIITGAGGYNASVWLNRVLVDTTNGLGIYIKDVFNVVSKDAGVHLTLGDSITLDGVTKGRFVNTSVFGAKSRAGAPPNASGIKLLACQDVLLSNSQAFDCTGDGFFLNNTVACSFTDVTSRGNLGRGMEQSGTSNYNVVSSAYFIGNSEGSLLQVGAQSATVNWYPNSSLYTASTLGAATVA